MLDAQEVQRYRLSRLMTIKQMAEKCGVCFNVMINAEHGRNISKISEAKIRKVLDSGQ